MVSEELCAYFKGKLSLQSRVTTTRVLYRTVTSSYMTSKVYTKINEVEGKL